jgi:uncharacterized protein YbbC (DUF1343 family)
LVTRSEVKIKALFGPEHGIRGKAPDRKGIGHEVDPESGIPIYSLFGKTTKPTRAMLKGIDALVFDIQDVGVRFYTYSTTLALTMEAAAEQGLPYIVLDRPNPIGGLHVDGPMLDPSLRSFVGWLPLPIVHGLTMGELAAMINGEHWLRKNGVVKLNVVRMRGWRRSWTFDSTELRWINPSPSIRSLQTALIYPGTCLIEGTNVSEGRGTDHPFEQIGAPWIHSRELCSKLRALHIPGVAFTPTSFTPQSTRTVTTDSKFEGELCKGVFLKVVDNGRFQPVKAGLALLWAIQALYPSEFRMKTRRLDELIGTRSVRQAIRKGENPNDIANSWKSEAETFAQMRKKYLMYT